MLIDGVGKPSKACLSVFLLASLSGIPSFWVQSRILSGMGGLAMSSKVDQVTFFCG